MAINILDNIDMRKLGIQLQQARKKRGMTQEGAAQVIGAVRTTMVAIEKGERRIRAVELIALARAYGKPVSDFVRERPVVEPFEVQFRATFKQSEEEKAKIEPVIAELEELCRDYLELEQIVDAPLARNFPPEYPVEDLPIEVAAESIAVSERNRLGIGDGPLPLLRDILEQDVGLRIFYLKMPPKFSEIYGYDERLGGCMAINGDHPEERRRWSLAHGYLHFLAHRRKPIFHYDGQYQRIPVSEQLADSFPKYFLMPASGLLKRFNEMVRAHSKFTPANLCTLAHFYGVSVQALIYRLEGMVLLPTGTWDRLQARGFKVRQAQQELGLEAIPQRPDKMPIHYQHLAIEAFDQGLITEGRFAKFLGVDRLEARRIAELRRERSGGVTDGTSQLELRRGREGAGGGWGGL
jgi:Zn-dependent peptidase ImmA (M78 family)/DNA-binding XRE family transcriptional regulator